MKRIQRKQTIQIAKQVNAATTEFIITIAKACWIYRAVANLLDNAIKYGSGKPVLLSVTAKHNRYRINELNKDGYGIGLSLVSHVCDLCGGFVTVESELDKGSTFYLSFPQKLF